MILLRELLESHDFHRIPLQTLNTGHYKLSLKINGIRGSFILDTGASNSCIDLDCAVRFNLNDEKSDVKAAGAGAINMQTKLARKNTLSIGSKSLSKVDFVLFDLGHVNEALSQVEEPPVQGIIGADLLKKLRAVIDYGRNTLYLK